MKSELKAGKSSNQAPCFVPLPGLTSCPHCDKHAGTNSWLTDSEGWSWGGGLATWGIIGHAFHTQT